MTFFPINVIFIQVNETIPACMPIIYRNQETSFPFGSTTPVCDVMML